MKNKLFWILLSLTTAVHATSVESSLPPLLMPLPQQAEVAHTGARLLTRFHYKILPLDNAMSEQIYDRYLKALDPDKLFFSQADIDHFSSARTKLDDAIFNDDLKIPFAIFNLYERRIIDRLSYARSLLKKGFDFKQKENYFFSREKADWEKSEEAIKDLWRKRVKNDWLMLKLAGKTDKAIRTTLDKRYEKSLSRIYKNKSEDVFQTFMDAYASSIEPHTNYLGPKASDSFNISMKLSLDGIGAVLVEKDELTTIRELVPGGPAILSGKLAVGDRIIGVGQGTKSAITDVIGWRIDDTVELIRGTKGTTVRLEILPVGVSLDGKHKFIELIRDKINLEQQAAKKSIQEIKNGKNTHKIGVITLPAFYQDFEAYSKGDPNYRSASRDVSLLLEELKNDQVDSILIDLRNDGGGSLTEAIKMTGLFIKNGPVVQQRNAGGSINVERDTDEGVTWDGPLGVLINRASASASEIFAAAIQDYGRGIILGETSFGKGTVQTVVDLDQLSNNQNDKQKFGGIKMTVAQFFRINGGTTQLRGVTPDISFPSASDSESFGESSYDNALPWSEIEPADYRPIGNVAELLPALKARHEVRTVKNKEFQYLLADIAEYKARRNAGFISLNFAERRKERNVREARDKMREKESGMDASSKHRSSRDDGLQSSERTLSEDLAEEKVQKDVKDILLNAAANTLSDAVELLQMDRRLVKTQ